MQPRFSDEGPSDRGTSVPGSGGRPSQPDFSIRKRDGPKLLRAVAKKYNIVSTESLVAAYNTTTVENERTVLLGWLREYGEGNHDCLKLGAVLEYAQLAKISYVSEPDAEVLRNLVYGLGSLLRPSEYLDENVAKALSSALTWVDAAVYDDTARLMDLGLDLLLSLSSRPRLTKQNFLKYEATFFCIHQVFFLLQIIGRGNLLEKEKKELRRVLAWKREEMELSILYYPVSFHFELIQQAVERLEIEDVPSHFVQAKRYTASGLYVGMHLFHFLRKMAGGDIDLTSIEDAYRRGRTAITNAGVSKREWYDILQILTAARTLVLKEETKVELFALAYDAAMEGQRKTTRENEQKALRFGIVQEMRLLVWDNDPSSNDGCKEATGKLVKLAIGKLVELATNQAISENWIHDADILTAILHALHAIHKTSAENRQTAEAVQKIQRCCDEHAKMTLTVWLDGNTIEEKLRMQPHDNIYKKYKNVFVEIGTAIGYLHLSTICSNIKELKQKYQHDDFATVPSLFESEIRIHVKDMEHHIVMYEEIIEKRNESRGEQCEDEEGEREVESSMTQERDDPKEHCEQKRKVTTPISIEDLFKPRSLKAGVGKSDIRRVLLYGNPGSGKTCISKSIAHRWALGQMLQEFEAIYVVPIGRLNTEKAKGVRGEALGEVIAGMCFKQNGSNAEFEELKIQVSDDLGMSSTLLVFDGLDEADDDARELLSQAEKGNCKLLILTRPYNLRGIQTRVDCQFECLGFNDQQLKNYINKELQQHKASRLIHSLQENQGLWETAHIPVTAHILCCLSKQHGTSIENRGKRASMFQIYGDMTNYVWERFKERPEARMVNKDIVFGDLEKIAFEALRSGQILIEERIVKSHATSTNTSKIFKESGFLLLVLEGQKYQFPHLTFQEYFAGRFVAKSLKSKGSDEERRVLKFIRQGKYNQKNDLTMHFVMHTFAKGRGKDALKEMLSVIDNRPVEVLGIQHFLLKMRILEATLEESDEDDLEDFLKNEQAIKLAEGARQLLERTTDDILIREIVIEEFQRLPYVLEGFPQVLDEPANEVKRLLANNHALTWKEMAKVTDTLKLIRHSPKHSGEITEFILPLAKEPGRWCHSEECAKRFESVVVQLPQHDSKLLRTLASWCGDKRARLRETASDAINRIVTTAPQHATKLLLLLDRWCEDRDLEVRRCAMEIIGRVISAAPENGEKHLPRLKEGYSDRNFGVRCDANAAILIVSKASPQYAYKLLSTLAHEWNEKDLVMRRDAMEAIGRIIAGAQRHADKVLPTLAKGCCDEDSDVRKAAMEAIGNVIAAAPQLGGDGLSMLTEGWRDEDSTVQKAAVEATGHVIAAAHQYVGEVLTILAEVCDDVNSNVRMAAMESTGHVIAAAPQLAGEVLPTMAKGCCDEDSAVRMAAMESTGHVIAAAPQLAGEVLPTMAKGCCDEDSAVRMAAMESTGHIIAAAPKLAGEILPTLEKGCCDEDSAVRLAAMESIGHVIAAAPQLAGEVLKTVAKGCCDEDSAVRLAAMEFIGHVIAAAPQLAGEVLKTVAKGCCDEDSAVRMAAMEATGQVIAAAPQLASEVLPTMAKGCCDEDSAVRMSAMESIGHVIAAAPQLAGEVLPTLAKGCCDEDSDVRKAAMEAIGNVIAAAPQLGGEVLPTLAKGCCDEDGDVGNAARTALVSINPEKAVSSAISTPHAFEGDLLFFFVQNPFTLFSPTKLKKVPFVLHASSSQEIGRWDNEALDAFVNYLKREFDEKFPGLLGFL